MESIVIYYFSGTGNSEKVADQTIREFRRRGVPVDLFSIERLLVSDDSLALAENAMIGIAHPIYGFGTPRIIDDFISRLPQGEGRKLFLIKTGADYISLNHNASRLQIKELRGKGYDVFYDRIIVMPSNWLLAYCDSMNKQLFNAVPGKVKNMCAQILEGKKRMYQTGLAMRYFSLGIAFLEKKYGSKSFSRSLCTNSGCNLCRICTDNCPVGNIGIIDGKITFGDKCLYCMRCIYNCPAGAIFSRGYNFTILGNGYNPDRILENDRISADFIDKNTRGFFKHFIRYLDDEEV